MANPTATFDTSMGQFKAEIFLDEMPVTAQNFISLAKDGFYDGLDFHRVVPNFVVQGGDPRGPRNGVGPLRSGTLLVPGAGEKTPADGAGGSASQ